MSVVYLDASAVVKRYVDEVGSEWIRSLIVANGTSLLFTSRMTIVEVISAFTRRVREGSLTPEELKSVENAFRGDCVNAYQIMPPTPAVIDLACELIGRYPLRAYDATHLASALTVQDFLANEDYPRLVFVSADDRLNTAASSEGLLVDNPNQHR